MTTTEVRNKAAAYIERNGWWRGFSGLTSTGECPQCLWTAMCMVVGQDDYSLCYQAAREMGFRGRSYSKLGDAVFEWNDAPERTKAEVLARLRGR